jgi:hypothetical protein
MKNKNDSVMLGIDGKNLIFEMDQKENIVQKRGFLKGLLIATVLTVMTSGYVEDAGARLTPAVCAALPAAMGVGGGGVIDDFGGAPAITPAMQADLLNILYVAFAESLVRPGVVANDLASLVEAILKAGGVISNSALQRLAAIPAIGGGVGAAALNNHTAQRPMMVIAIANALLAGVPVAPGAVALNAAKTAARNLNQPGVPPAITALANAAPGAIAGAIPAAAGVLAATAAIINPNPISYSYNHMRDMRHLWQLPAGAAAGVLDAHYFAWCRAARTSTAFPFPPDHSSFTLSPAPGGGGAAPGPQGDFATILAAIAGATLNPANIVGIDTVNPGSLVDIFVNVGAIAGINVIRCNLNAAPVLGLLPNINEDAINVIARATYAIMAPPPAAAAPAALAGLAGTLVPAAIPAPGAIAAILGVGGAVGLLAVGPRVAAAHAATGAVVGAIGGLGVAAQNVTNITNALNFLVVNNIYNIPNNIQDQIQTAAEAAATANQAISTAGLVTPAIMAGGPPIPAFLQLQAVAAAPVAVPAPIAAIIAAIPPNVLADAMAQVTITAGGLPIAPILAAIIGGAPLGGVAGAAAVNALLVAITGAPPLAGVVPGGAAGVAAFASIMQLIHNASAALLPAAVALAAPAGPQAAASAPQPVGIITIRIAPNGTITSIFPK